MKKITAFFVILLFYKCVIAQSYIPFPNDSAEWHNILTCQLPSCPPTSPKPPDLIEQKGDTIINSKNYHKLYNKTNNTLYSFYREFNKVIYSKYPLGGMFANDTAEFVLYNFNLNIGDTFYVKIPSSWNFIVEPASLKRVVSSITYTVMPSGIHKVFNFQSFSGNGCQMFAIKWIEGVGSDAGLLFNLNYYYWSKCISYPGPYDITLTCNFRNSNLYFSNGCTITALHKQNILKEDIILYPNPANTSLKIESSTGVDILSVLVFDMQGKLVLEKKLPDYIQSIDISNLDNGIYLFQIKNKYGVINKKLLIQN